MFMLLRVCVMGNCWVLMACCATLTVRCASRRAADARRTRMLFDAGTTRRRSPVAVPRTKPHAPPLDTTSCVIHTADISKHGV